MHYKNFLPIALSSLSLVLAGCTLTPANNSTLLPPTPVSGTYLFTMELGTNYLSGSNCPSEALTFTTEGKAELDVATDGSTIGMQIESENLQFSRVGGGVYETASSPFPTKDGQDNAVTGSVFFNLTPRETTVIDGLLKWDNTVGCTGTYPFLLEYELPD